MLVECTPKTVLDERDDLRGFEHFSEAELLKLKALYAGSHCTDTVNYLMTQMNEILAHNLYTTVAPPEDVSLKVICELYPYIEKLLGEKTPAVKPLEKYSIYEQDCWGDFSVGIRD